MNNFDDSELKPEKMNSAESGGKTITTTTKIVANVYWDPTYLQTYVGVLKASKVVVNLLGFICAVMSVESDTGIGNWYCFVSMTAFWATLVLLFLYMFHAVERLYFLPFLLGECVFCSVWSFFYMLASIMVAARAAYSEAFGAAAFFGFVAMVLYAFDAYIKFRSWKRGDLAQGERYMVTTGNEPQETFAY